MRCAYFGGSFDPIHAGHMAIADDVLATRIVERIVFLPSGRPPHKRDRELAKSTDRVAMIEIAIAGKSDYSIDGRELSSSTPTYTILTMESVRAERPHDEFAFLIGLDSLRDLDKWYRIADLVRLVEFIVVGRPGIDEKEARERAARIPGLRYRFLTTRLIDVSSSDIRRRVADGRSIEGLVPAGVAAFIRDRGLYAPPAM